MQIIFFNLPTSQLLIMQKTREYTQDGFTVLEILKGFGKLKA